MPSGPQLSRTAAHSSLVTWSSGAPSSVIVGGRGIGVNVDGNHNRNTMSFEFEDGSRFTVQNSIVLSYSVYGKPFYRYPTTFHNVILPNGDKLRNPSEAKIKKEFAK